MAFPPDTNPNSALSRNSMPPIRDYDDFDDLLPGELETARQAQAPQISVKKQEGNLGRDAQATGNPAPAPSAAPSQPTTHNSQPTTHNSQPTTHNSQLTTSPRRHGLVSEFAVLLLVLGAFVFVCVPALSRFVVPLNGDEVDTAWRFVFNQHASKDMPWDLGVSHSGMYNLVFWLRALPYSHAWFQTHSDAWCRAASVAGSVMMLLVFYGFARWMLGPAYALLVVFLGAFMHYNLFMSVEGGYFNETSAVYIAAAWAFLAGEKARRWWAKALFGLLAAVLAAVVTMQYFSGRLILLPLAIYVGIRFIEDKTWLRRNAPLLITLSIYVLVLVKLRHDLETHPYLTSYRQTSTQLLYKPQLDWALSSYQTRSVIVATAKNIGNAFRGYYSGPNAYHAYSTPIGFLDRYGFWLAAVGALWMLWRWRTPAFLLLILFILRHNPILGGLPMLPYPPYHQRVHLAISICAFALALPLWGLTRIRWRPAARMGAVLAVAAALFLAQYNIKLYYDRVLSGKDDFIKNYAPFTSLAYFMNTNLAQYEFITHNESGVLFPFDSQMNTWNPGFRDRTAVIVPFSTWKTRSAKWHPERAGRRLLFIIQDPCPAAIPQEIERHLPGGRWITEPFDGCPHYRVYVPPLHEKT